MPSHIYTRVGYWKDSIDSNIASSKRQRRRSRSAIYLHAQDYMVYAHLQLGEDKEASAVLGGDDARVGFQSDCNGRALSLAAAPARYAVERGDWNGASQSASQARGR